MSRTPAGIAFTQLVIQIFRLNGLLLEAGDRLSAPVGQTSARWQVMGCIDREPRSVAEIARLMGLARQSVQRVADRLVEDGVARYEDNPAHKRAKLLRLTERGQKALNFIERAQHEWANRLGEAIGVGELERANAVLERLRQLLESDAAKTKRGRATAPGPGSSGTS